MNKRVLITGSGGFVGKNLYQLAKENLFDVYGVDLYQKPSVDNIVDITDEVRFLGVLDQVKPSFIVHTAALSNVERCETEQELAYKNNILPTKTIAAWANKNDATMIYLSSDYVYDGVKGCFTEADPVNPIQYYGHTKLMGEKLVSELAKHVILRPTVIYGWDHGGMNFFMQLCRSQNDKKELKIPIDQVSNPTYVKDICELIIKIFKTPDKYGIFISTGPESMSRYDFALQLCDHMSWNKNLIIPVETKHLGQIASRPLNNSTNSQKLRDHFSFQFRNLSDIHRHQLIDNKVF